MDPRAPNRTRVVATSLALLGLAAPGALPAAPIAADLFTTALTVSTPAGSGARTGSDQVDGPGSIIGGNREVVVGQGGGVHRIASVVAGGLWSVSALGGIDVDQGFARMTWDRGGGSAAAPDFGGPGFDLTDGGTNDRWLMTYRSPTLVSFWNTRLKLYTDAANWIQYEVAGPVAPASGAFGGIGNVLNPGQGAGGVTRAGSVNFADVRAIELTLTEPRAADESFRIDVIGLFFLSQNDTVGNDGIPRGAAVPDAGGTTVIPVPGALALLLSGLGALAVASRRRAA